MSSKKPKILVTGGSGFIGTNLVDYYLAKNYEVMSLDSNPPRKKKHESLWRKVDILDLPSLEKNVLEFNPTHLFHLAARTDLDERKNIDGYIANTKGVENVVAVVRICKDLQRVMFTSSMFVCYPGYNPADYDDYAPHTVYGESKVMTERIVKSSDLGPLEWFITRPASIWGPWFGAPYNEFFHHVNRGRYFRIIGKTATKTYGFVYNSVYQMDTLMFAESLLVNKKTFYIGDSPGLNINDWAIEIANQMNRSLKPIPLIVIRAGGWVGDLLQAFKVKFPLQSFRVKNMTTDNTIALLHDTLKIVPEQPYSVKQGVAFTIDWLKSADPEWL